MAARHGAGDALPTSHFFVTVSRGQSHRTVPLRSGVVFAGLAVLPFVVLWLIGSTLYLTLHDDLVASLMLRQRDMQYGYEDQLAALHSQLDRSASRELMTQRSIAAKLDELTLREADLQTRSGVVSRLDEQASRIFEPAAKMEERAHSAASAPSDPAVAAHAALEPANVRGASSRPGATDRLSSLSSRLDAISAAQDSHVAALDQKVRTTMSRYRDALDTAGLSLDRLKAAIPRDMGGPFVPLTTGDDATPFARSAVGLQLSLSEATRVAGAIAHVPLNKPLQGNPEVTSPFGPRIDPFLGRPAMHTGIDLAEDLGTDVFPTAPGRVTFAGQASGYGLMIEVDHGAGLSTRYAHLSAIDTAVGQAVKCGEVIGHVGATGRATGPHLHYETRIDGEAVDPTHFLAAGKLLLSER